MSGASGMKVQFSTQHGKAGAAPNVARFARCGESLYGSMYVACLRYFVTTAARVKSYAAYWTGFPAATLA
jgi:hypothetical protein